MMISGRQSRNASQFRGRARQQGAVAVEFALVASLLFTLLFGITEMSRILFYWNTAGEVTRLGARLAVVCGKDATVIKTRMSNMLGILAPGKNGYTIVRLRVQRNKTEMAPVVVHVARDAAGTPRVIGLRRR